MADLNSSLVKNISSLVKNCQWLQNCGFRQQKKGLRALRAPQYPIYPIYKGNGAPRNPKLAPVEALKFAENGGGQAVRPELPHTALKITEAVLVRCEGQKEDGKLDDFAEKKRRAIEAVREQEKQAKEARKNFKRTTSPTDDFGQPWGWGWGGHGSWSPKPPAKKTKNDESGP